MLDDNPVLRERLMAFGAFAGIATFGIASVNVMISGGFDFGSERAPYHREQPITHVRVTDAAQYVSDRVQRASWDESLPITEAATVPAEDLAGENDGTPPPSMEQTSDEDLRRAIADLYAGQSRSSYDDYAYSAEAAGAAKPVSASENASPW
ncbi:MAG: hypothetical protein KF779_11165 [Hyphomonadaceae bacterium]|nr:hypothetical protein [Hyphomonadaceae bacterium]